MQETQERRVRSLGQKDPLEEEMATQSSILAWRIPWTEEPGGLQFMGLQTARHDLANRERDSGNLSPLSVVLGTVVTVCSLPALREDEMDFQASRQQRVGSGRASVALFHGR